MFQIYLLTAKPSKAVTIVFRVHLNYLNGPLLALIFSETETRMVSANKIVFTQLTFIGTCTFFKLPLEATVYWVQHGMMFVVPYYLLRLGGTYTILFVILSFQNYKNLC